MEAKKATLTLSLQCWQLLKLVLHEASCRTRSREIITILQCWHRFGLQSQLVKRTGKAKLRVIDNPSQEPNILSLMCVDGIRWKFLVTKLAFGLRTDKNGILELSQSLRNSIATFAVIFDDPLDCEVEAVAELVRMAFDAVLRSTGFELSDIEPGLDVGITEGVRLPETVPSPAPVEDERGPSTATC